MIKALIKYLPFLCILFLRGYSQVPPNPDKESAYCISIKNIKTSEYSSFDEQLNSQALIIKSATSDKENRFSKIDAREVTEEDEHEISSKKNLTQNYFPVISGTKGLSYFFSYGKKTLPFYKDFSCSLSFRYILFQVFRI